jgi:hypothetical protein
MSIPARHVTLVDVLGHAQQTFFPAETDAEIRAIEDLGRVVLAAKRSGVGKPSPRRAGDIAAARVFAASNFR